MSGGLEKPFDIRERTFLFGVRVVRFVRTLPKEVASIELARQLLRSGTSAGANVEEADGAESKRDKIHKYSVARKGAKETRFCLRTIKEAEISTSPEGDALQAESLELNKILSSIINNLNRSAD
jgi:four helix bundle protein